jgi:tetratricopeptide (TPR) repeat protein
METPLLTAALALRAGRRCEALAGLAEAQRRDPGDPGVAHMLLLACYHTLRGGQLPREEAAPLVERLLASWVMLLHHDRFWTSWLDERLRRYGEERPEPVAARQELVAALTARIEELGAAGGDPRCFTALLQREITAAEQLAIAGGFPALNEAAGPLLCGPLMIQALGCAETFGAFVAALPTGDERTADRVRGLFHRLLGDDPPAVGRPLLAPEARDRLRRLFSHLGLAEALLDLDQPEDAWALLAGPACPQCRTAAEGALSVCTGACPSFAPENPGYAGAPEAARRLERDALELAVRIQLSLGHAAMTATESDADSAARHFREALRLAAAGGRHKETESQVVDAVLGRVKVIAGKGDLEPAIALLEACCAACAEAVPGPGPAPREQLTGRLAELLARRGAEAGQDRRWEDAVTDLLRAADLNPHAAAPVLHLSLALQGRARQVRKTAPAQAVELVLEAVRQLQARLADLAGQPEAREHIQQTREAARSLLLRQAGDLASAGGFEQSLQILEQGLAVLPGDPVLGGHHREMVLRYARSLDERGQSERALAVLRRAK